MVASNVLLVTIDSLRADHTCCQGYDVDVDPNIEALSEDGVIFTQSVANGPNTTASFPSILTGCHSMSFGPYGICGDDSPFLSRMFRENGFQTFGFHSNPYLGKEQNYPKGFDTFEDAVEGTESVATLKDRIERRITTGSKLYKIMRRAWHAFSVSTNSSAYARADTISDNAISWFEQEWSGDRFFGWLHYMDVHYPFQPPSEDLNTLFDTSPSKRRVLELNGKMQEAPEEMTERDIEDLMRLYDAEIRFTDRQIGRVFDTLREIDALEDTLIVVTADHGEAFGEHGQFGHHPYPYEELIRVPLIIKGPSVTTSSVEKQVSLVDLGPTVLDRTGVEPPNRMDGRSFAPLLDDDNIEGKPALIISDNGQLFGCRTPGWKYIKRWGSDEEYLFDLDHDPGESENVLSSHPDVARQLQSHIDDYREGLGGAGERKIEQSEQTRQRLEKLGYLE